MKMIQLASDHYVFVDDSPIETGDWCYNFSGIDGTDEPNIIQATKYAVKNWQDNMTFNRGGKEVYLRDNLKKITHSTKPLMGGYKFIYGSQGKIELSEVKELLGEVDVEKKAEELTKHLTFPDERKEGIIIGYNQCLEDNKHNKYTEEDMRKAHEYGLGYRNGAGQRNLAQEERDREFNNLLQSLQPKTQWEVELIDGKLKLK